MKDAIKKRAKKIKNVSLMKSKKRLREAGEKKEGKKHIKVPLALTSIVNYTRKDCNLKRRTHTNSVTRKEH